MAAHLPRRLSYLYHVIRQGVNLRSLTKVLIILAVLSGLATYPILTNKFQFAGATIVQMAYLLFFWNILLLSALALVVIIRVTTLYVRRRRGLGASRFHSRLAFIFSSFAIVPTLIAGFFSTALYERSVQVWFDSLTKGIIEEASSIAGLYHQELNQSLKSDALDVSYALRQEIKTNPNKERLQQFVDQVQKNRGLAEVAIYNNNFAPVVMAQNSYVLRIEEIDHETKVRLLRNEIRAFVNDKRTRARVMLKVHPNHDLFLMVGRRANEEAFDYLQRVKLSKERFIALEKHRWELRIYFFITYALITILLLLTSIVVGVSLADYISKPVEQLIQVAQRIRAGDWSTRVEVQNNVVEFLGLARAFNKMMAYINNQKQALELANVEIEERRRFIETTLAGVSAGVIALDNNNKVILFNASAINTLGLRSPDTYIGRDVTNVLPQVKEIFLNSKLYPQEPITDNIIINVKGSAKHLLIRIAAEINEGGMIGQVITFDDLTDLITAQKKAAWGDVARQVAHEIKNPLTPIQLSAERLKRRFAPPPDDKDSEVFNTCVDTITRKVDDIYRIVYEFSSFARMPQAVKKEHNLLHIIKSTYNQMKAAYPQVAFAFESQVESATLFCDEQLLTQVTLNILKNAIESFEDIQNSTSETHQIKVSFTREPGWYVVSFQDNGSGFTEADPMQYLKPYITTKKKGSGLGLAIVKRIIEEHEGTIILENAAEGGAKVMIKLPDVLGKAHAI